MGVQLTVRSSKLFHYLIVQGRFWFYEKKKHATFSIKNLNRPHPPLFYLSYVHNQAAWSNVRGTSFPTPTPFSISFLMKAVMYRAFFFFFLFFFALCSKTWKKYKVTAPTRRGVSARPPSLLPSPLSIECLCRTPHHPNLSATTSTPMHYWINSLTKKAW